MSYGMTYGRYGEYGRYGVAPAADADACSGLNMFWPGCIKASMQDQVQDASDAVAQRVRQEIWQSIRIPVLILGVGILAYVVTKKARKRRR